MTCTLCADGYPRILGRHLNATRGGRVKDLGPCEEPNAPEPQTPDAKAIAASAKLHEIANRVSAASVLQAARASQHMTMSQPREVGEDDGDDQ